MRAVCHYISIVIFLNNWPTSDLHSWGGIDMDRHKTFF